MTGKSLEQMLNIHKMVYVKPDIGTFGNGVMRVEWQPGAEQPYSYQSGEIKRRFKHFGKLYASIVQKTRNRPYLVQKGIHLLTYKGSRFDLRVMVQQSPQRKWEATGIIGRVAHPRKIVTNFHNGGTLKPAEALFAGYMNATEREQFIGRLRTLGLQAARAMHARYPGVMKSVST